jgi:hypothetical protein
MNHEPTDQEILSRWRELLAAGEGLEFGSAEYERLDQAAREFAATTPRHARLIAAACFRRLAGRGSRCDARRATDADVAR